MRVFIKLASDSVMLLYFLEQISKPSNKLHCINKI